MKRKQHNIKVLQTETLIDLANRVFEGIPERGFHFEVLCHGLWLCYQKVFRGGNLDSRVGIYKEVEKKPCENFLPSEAKWKEKVVGQAASS
jgi:hypothetical protein